MGLSSSHTTYTSRARTHLSYLTKTVPGAHAPGTFYRPHPIIPSHCSGKGVPPACPRLFPTVPGWAGTKEEAVM